MKTPPLQLLPSFEAVARLLSFKQAAEELCVTSSAVSQQIKLLESLLEIKLFERNSRNVRLTEDGQRLYQIASSTLQYFDTEFRRFATQVNHSTLRLSTSAFIAYDILIPAIQEFSTLQPRLDLRIETSETIVDLELENFSAAVRIGEGNWSGLHSRLLAPLDVTIAGSQSVIDSFPLRKINDLKKFPLLHARSNVNDWELVSEALNIDLSKNKQIFFDSYLAAIGAAEQGLGLVVALLPITSARLNRNDLVPLADHWEKVPGRGFYFVQRKGTEENQAIDALYLWVRKQFNKLNSNPVMHASEV